MLEALFSIHVIGPLKCDPPSPHPPPLFPKKCFPQREKTLYEADLPANSYHQLHLQKS